MTIEENVGSIYFQDNTRLLCSRIAEGWSETKRRLVPMAFETFDLLLILGITHWNAEVDDVMLAPRPE